MNRDEGGQLSDFMGGHHSYEGGHKAHRGIPQSPLTRENPAFNSHIC